MGQGKMPHKKSLHAIFKKQTIQNLIQEISNKKSQQNPNPEKIQNFNQQLQEIYYKKQRKKINRTEKHFSKLKTRENTYRSNHKIILTNLQTFYKYLYVKTNKIIY